MMKKFLALLFLISFSFAIYPGNITVTPFEYKDFGKDDLPVFNVTMKMDCVEKKLSADVSSGGAPVPGVTTYLKYVQYDNPLLSTKISDSSGQVTHMVHGNISFMTGIWVLVMEKADFRKREAHFEILDCLVNVTGPPQNVTPPQNITPPKCTSDNDCKSSEICNIASGKCEKLSGACGYAYNHTWIGYECCQDADCGAGKECDEFSNECKEIKIEPNVTTNITTPNVTNITNQTGVDGEEGELCPIGLILLIVPAMIFLKNN
jgi:hypothetical protein